MERTRFSSTLFTRGASDLPLTTANSQKAMHKIADLVAEHGVNLVAIGNGKGHREAELLVAQAIKERSSANEELKTLRYIPHSQSAKTKRERKKKKAILCIYVVTTITRPAFDRFAIVSESGASAYSASTEAAKEFPELEARLRGTISIARRLLDPLSEMIKVPIPPLPRST